MLAGSVHSSLMKHQFLLKTETLKVHSKTALFFTSVKVSESFSESETRLIIQNLKIKFRGGLKLLINDKILKGVIHWSI